MELLLVATVVLLVVNLAVVLWLLWRLRRTPGPDQTPQLDASLQLLKADLLSRQAESLLALRQSIDSANRIINERLAEGTSALDRRMSIVNEIEHRLGELSRQAENIEAVGKNIQSLSELLRPPRSRGKVGEIFLENLLGEVLPTALFETQHKFSDGQRVDAIVKIGNRILPIDAKFPLESYERLAKQPEDEQATKEFVLAIRRHTDAIHEKYIRPHEQTTDFAVMYIPAEAVYYQLVAGHGSDGFDYALSKSVIPSSPGHLYGFLASVAALHSEFGLARASLDRDSRWLVNGLKQLEDTTARLDKLHERMSGSLRALASSLERSRSELQQISYQLTRLREPVAEEVGEARSSAPDGE
jgi:DNA recombination protein RmuC